MSGPRDVSGGTHRVNRRRPPLGTAATIALAVLALAPTGGGPGRTSVAAPAPSAPAATPDFSGYQALLNDWLTVISAKGEPLDTRFDYEWYYDKQGRFERGVRIRRQMLAVPPSTMDERTRLAWAINMYNYLVLETATEYLLVPGRGRLRHQGTRDIMTPEGRFFLAKRFEIEGRTYSLEEFERFFLFADYDPLKGGDPPPNLDPRVHFAVVCGALGCPPLLPRAYRADSLKIQLEFATRNALALPRHLSFTATGQLQGSAIFQWYTRDFGGIEKAFEFAMKYAPAKIRAEVKQRKVTGLMGTVPWDWNLNQTVHKKEI